jgi:hypothetical protein
MPIKNKDGSVFKLQGPNPLMKSQDLDGENIIVHNLNPEETTGSDPSRQFRDFPNPYEIVDVNKSVEEFLGTEDIKPPKIEQPKPKSMPGGIKAWCLPAVTRQTTNIYGEIKRSVDYLPDQKFQFATVVLARTIIACELTCPVRVEKGSIILLSEEREWWRVVSLAEKSDGFVLTCYPSDHHPSF